MSLERTLDPRREEAADRVAWLGAWRRARRAAAKRREVLAPADDFDARAATCLIARREGQQREAHAVKASQLARAPGYRPAMAGLAAAFE